MSVIAQVAATVAATPLPTPFPTPDLPALAQQAANAAAAKANVPDVVIQAAQVLGVIVVTALFSIAHRVAEYVTAKEKGWGPRINTLLASAYTLGVGVVGAATMHQLGASLTGLVAIVLNSGTASIGSFWGYAIHSKLFGSLLGGTKTVEPPVVLATEQDPAQGVG